MEGTLGFGDELFGATAEDQSARFVLCAANEEIVTKKYYF
jgi:hypothetical protein